MEGTMAQYPPGDPKMIDTIVHQLKSQGIFDQFRKECIADVDTKPAYQNLHQRVEGTVSGFLANQVWRPDMNKNLLRDSLRKHIHESGFLEMGVERIVDQVVNPKVLTVFVPQVEDVVYNFLGIEKPKKSLETQYSKPPPFSFNIDHSETKKEISFTDLLPKDLDPISPESDITKRADNSAEEGELNDDRDEEQSPPFKPLRDINENSAGSSLSGISGLTSPDSRHSTISFNGVLKDRPVTPCMSPIETADNEARITVGAVDDRSLTRGEMTADVKHPPPEVDSRDENEQSRVAHEETKKSFVVAEPDSSDEDSSSSSTSRPSSSNSDSSSSSYSSSSDGSSGPEAVEQDPTSKRIEQADLKSIVAEEKPVKKEKREAIIVRAEKPEKVIRDRKEDRQDKIDTKHDSDAKLLKKIEQGEKEEKVVKKEEKEKKSVRSHEKDDKSTKKHEKEAPSVRTTDKEEKLFSMFDQADTTVKRSSKEEKSTLKIGKEEKPIRKEEREEKLVRHSEKDSSLHAKEEKLGKSPSKHPKDVKSSKPSDGGEKSLHKNGDGKLSSKEGDNNKKPTKKDAKEDKIIKTKVDEKIDKSMKKDDKSSKNYEKDVKSYKKEGKHKVDTDSSSQDSKAAEGKNHQKSSKPVDKERAKPSDKSVPKDDKSKQLEDKSKQHQDKSTKPAGTDRSKPVDKSRRDDKYKIKNGSADKERSAKQDGKGSSVKAKHEDVKTDPKSKPAGKHKDGKKEKGKPADDHGRHRDKRSDDRGSTDRDSNGARDRSSSSSRTPAAGSREAGHREKRGGGSGGGKTGKGGNRDASEERARDSDTDSSSDGEDSDPPAVKKPRLEVVDPLLPCKGEYICINNEGKLVLKIKKPKIAANIYEVRKIMQQRRTLAKLEKKRQREFRRAQGISSSDESPVKSKKKDESLSQQNVLQPAKIPRMLQPAEIHEILLPAEIPEIMLPAEIPEIIQSTKIPEILQPAQTAKVVQPPKVPDVVKPAKIPEILQPAQIPEVMKPAEIPELVQPVKILKICVQKTEVSDFMNRGKISCAKITETVQPAKVPNVIEPAEIPEIIQSPKIPEMHLPAEISTRSKILQPSEIPLRTEILPLESTSEVEQASIEKVAPTVCSPVKIALPVVVQMPVEIPLKDPEYLMPESDDDEQDLKYFESPEINEYDRIFLSYMKVLTEDERLSDLDVCSVHSEDLDDFNDSSFSPPEGDGENSGATKHGGTISFVEDSRAPVASAGNNVKASGRNGKQRQAGVSTTNRRNATVKPSPTSPISKNVKHFHALQKNVDKTGGKATSLNDGPGAESSTPVSVKSKVELPKRLEDNASTIPTVRPQLPDDAEGVGGFVVKSPIPVGALSRHRVNGNTRKAAGFAKASTPQMRPPKVSPPVVEKREGRRSRKPNSKYVDGDYAASEPEAKSLPVSSAPPSHNASKTSSGNLSRSEIFDIVVGKTTSEGYGINNNEEKGGPERAIPTPDSRSSGGSSGSSGERGPRPGRSKGARPPPVEPPTPRPATPPAGADFVMPLSPESDVSASSGEHAKKMSADRLPAKSEDVIPAGADADRRQSNAVLTPASRGQRYSSDDLYKPRPLFNRLSRRTRNAAPAASDEAAEVAAVGATKRRASSVVTEPAPVPKRRR